MIARQQAVAIARTWIGTPYVLSGRMKGAGCDCATLIAEFLIECGFSNREDLGVYSHNWFCNTADERYMMRLIRHAPKVLESVCVRGIKAEPGSLVLFRSAGSRLYNHGGIVTEWPRIIHACYPRVKEIDTSSHMLTERREMALFDPWRTTEC